MASKQSAAALPPVRTGGKKVPAASPRTGAPPTTTPRTTGAGGGTSAPSAPAQHDDTKSRVAREREERMAAVRSAKAEAAQPASARGAPSNQPQSARGSIAPPAAAAAKKSSPPPTAATSAPPPVEDRRRSSAAAPTSEPTAAPKKAPSQKALNAAPAAAGGAKQSAPKEKKPSPPPETSANAPAGEVPLKNPKFNLDGPANLDVTKLAVYECFPNEGMLFRISESLPTTPPTYRWHFYNDTPDLIITAEVSFMLGSNVKLLETSTSRVDSNTGETVVKASIPPGKTQAFVEGRIRGYACGFSADEFKGEAREAQAADADTIRAAELSAMLAAAKEEHVDPNDQEAIVRCCVKRGVPFVDTAFTGKALFYRDGVDEPIDTFPLLRPTHYLPPALRNVIRLINTVEPNDIDQGLLGDCWFLCAISSLAEFPDKVEDIFEHPQGKEIGAAEAKVGAYRVTVMFDGWWDVVLLDDYFPSQGGRAAYAKNIEDPAELWVSFIEKAYAKLKGSYSNIVGGDALHALEDLTGYPTTRLDRKFNAAIDDEEAAESLFHDLLRYDEAGYLITLGTPSPDEDDPPEVVKAMEEKYDSQGLTIDHSYSVITVKDYPDKGIKLLKIRNPWGNEKEWSGAWGDESDDWKKHPDIAKDCGFDGPSSDGTYWMQWCDVLEYFESGGVCFMCRNWRDCRTRGTFSGGRPSVALRVTCNKPTKAFLVLSQAAKPGFDPKKPSAKYAGAMVSVWKPDADPSRYRTDLNSAFEFDIPTPEFTFLVGRSIGLLYSFKPSDKPYMVVPRIYDPEVTRDYCLGIISEHSVGDTTAHALNVEFVRIDGAETAFENFEEFKFDPQADATLVTVPYQINPEEGAPYGAEGTSVTIRDTFGEASVRRSFNC